MTRFRSDLPAACFVSETVRKRTVKTLEMIEAYRADGHLALDGLPMTSIDKPVESHNKKLRKGYTKS